MADTKQVRRANLEALVKMAGGQGLLAEKVNTSGSYISTLLSPVSGREVGDRLARRLEAAMNKPEGWMDVAHGRKAPKGEEAPGGGGKEYNVSESFHNVSESIQSSSPSTDLAGAEVAAYRNAADLIGGYVSFEVMDAAQEGGEVRWVSTGETVAVPVSTLERKQAAPGNCRVVEVLGRSMEPVLEAGYYVVVDTTQTRLIDGELYAVLVDGELMVRHYRRRDGRGMLVAANAEFEAVDASTAAVLGRKVWVCG